MTRSREGYLWSTKGIIEGLETDAVATSSSSIKDSYDVVIIGSGFAGLIAAREISQISTLGTLLVEGRDRIGGRTWTAKELGEQFEMGGTWVHWSQPHVYNELQRYGLHRNLKTSAGTSVAEKILYRPTGGKVQTLVPDQTYSLMETLAAKFFQVDGKTSRSLMPYPHDPLREPAPWRKYDHLTVKNRLDQMTDISQSDRNLFETYINSLGSAPGTGTGFVEFLRWYALANHSLALMFEMAGVYKLGKGGMSSFANAILSEYPGDRLFSTVVRKIEQNDSGVVLTADDGQQIRAKAVISTIPLNCLSDIDFSPSLSPLRQQAIQVGHINKGAKIHFKLSKQESPWFGTCDYGKDSPFCFAFSDHNGTKTSGPDGTYCIGFGYNGCLTDKKDDKDIVGNFQKCFDANADIEAYLTHDWMNDPLAKGVWCCWDADTMSKYLEELQKPHDRVLFASADWADGWRGFVDGAIERGRTAARQVVQMVRS